MLRLNPKLLIPGLIAICLAVTVSALADGTPLNRQSYTEPSSEPVSTMVEPANRAGRLSANDAKFETLIYQGCSVEISQQQPYLQVNHQPIAISQDPATGNYFSPDVPYNQFASLEELGQAYVDIQSMDCGA